MDGEASITLDATTSALVVEEAAGLSRELRETLHLLVGSAQAIACPAPVEVRTLAPAPPRELAAVPSIRLAGYWHDSLLEGPGRRSTAKLQGCPIRCRGFIYSLEAGHLLELRFLGAGMLPADRNAEIAGAVEALDERIVAMGGTPGPGPAASPRDEPATDGEHRATPEHHDRRALRRGTRRAPGAPGAGTP